MIASAATAHRRRDSAWAGRRADLRRRHRIPRLQRAHLQPHQPVRGTGRGNGALGRRSRSGYPGRSPMAARWRWSGTNLSTVFVQRRSLTRPRFPAHAGRSAALQSTHHRALAQATGQTSGGFLPQHRFSDEFRDWYFPAHDRLHLGCPTDQRMLQFPWPPLIPLLPQPWPVAGEPAAAVVHGAWQCRRYVEQIQRSIADKRQTRPSSASGVTRAGRAGHHGSGRSSASTRWCSPHSDQTSPCSPTPEEERAVLSAVRYQPNRSGAAHRRLGVAVRAKRPGRPGFERAADATREAAQVCLHYLINKLQPVPFAQPVVVC